MSFPLSQLLIQINIKLLVCKIVIFGISTFVHRESIFCSLSKVFRLESYVLTDNSIRIRKELLIKYGNRFGEHCIQNWDMLNDCQLSTLILKSPL